MTSPPSRANLSATVATSAMPFTRTACSTSSSEEDTWTTAGAYLRGWLGDGMPDVRGAGDGMWCRVKVAVVGGGSTYTPELADGIARLQHLVRVDELVLTDPSEERLRLVGGISQRIFAKYEYPGHVR